MSKRIAKQTVLKDFRELEVQKRIDMLSVRIYQLQFRGEQDSFFEPKKKTEIYRVWQMGKLEHRHQRAWKKFREDVDQAFGKSGGVTAPYGDERGDGNDREKMPTAYTNDAYRRLEYIFDKFLSWRERWFLYDLLQNDLRNGTDLKLEFIGLMRSGYTEEEKARAAGVVHVQNLLDRLADAYNY